MLLQELGAATTASNIEAHLPQHSVFASEHQVWRRGKGVAIALRSPLARALVGPPKIDNDLQLVHARLRGLLPDSTALLHVISCYMLCAQSQQLPKAADARRAGLEANYAALQRLVDDITATAPGDLVVLAGDLNARTGPAQAMGPASMAALLAAGLPTQRAHFLHHAKQPDPDTPGYLLNDLCVATDMINLTGIAPGDCPAQASWSNDFKLSSPPKTPGPAARIDHVLVSPSVVPHLRSCATCPDVRGSDHIPLHLTLALARAPAPAPAPTPTNKYQYRTIVPSTDYHINAAYITLLTADATWAGFLALQADPTTTLDQLSTAFTDLLFSTAEAAGFRVRTLTSDPATQHPLPPKTNSNYKCWHDRECKRLQQAFHAIPADTTDPAAAAQRAELRRLYRRRATRLLRQHKLAHAMEQLRLWRQDSTKFWRNYRPASSRCPIPAATAAAHFKTKMNSFPPAARRPAPAAPPERQLDATSACPTAEDIAAAIKSMTSTAAGVDGLPTYLFKPQLAPATPEGGERPALPPEATAANALAHIAAGLHAVFERVSAAGAVPDSWRTAVLVPIYKKGDQADVTNYRPLSVPTLACRVWSSLTNTALMKLVEDALPDTMFGFRPGFACTDPLFILRHLLDMRKHMPAKHRIFAVAFMDLSGAYDSVDRELLFWKLEHQLGIAAHTLATLRDLYRGTACTVKVDGCCSLPFAVACGLRQGCPLSTTLFNLFIWDLHHHLSEACPDAGVPIGPPPRHPGAPRPPKVLDLGYADDAGLCGSSPEELQRLIDCYCTYCADNGLIVNPTKCEAVVFGNGNAWRGRRSWTLPAPGGSRSAMAVVPKFKYLGVELHGAGDITKALDHRHSRMVAAQSAVNKRLKELRIPFDPMVVGGLFEATTAATGSYGCEIWSTPFLSEWCLLGSRCKLQSYQAAVYKLCLGVPKSTANLLTFFEMGRYPMQIQWLARTLRYWNKLAGLSTRSLLGGTFVANVAAGLGCGRTNTWAAELRAALQFVCPDPGWTAHMLQGLPIDVAPVVAAAQQAFCTQLHAYSGTPEADNCAKRHFCKYATHMVLGGTIAEHDQLPVPAYLAAFAPLARKRALAQLRLNSTPIQTNLLRSTDGVQYSQRLCPRGCATAVDTEQHMLFECLATEEARALFWDELDLASTDMRGLMDRVYQQDKACLVMDFIYYATNSISGQTA